MKSEIALADIEKIDVRVGEILRVDDIPKSESSFGIVSEAMLFDIGYADGITPVLALPETRVPNGACAG